MCHGYSEFCSYSCSFLLSCFYLYSSSFHSNLHFYSCFSFFFYFYFYRSFLLPMYSVLLLLCL